MRVRPRFRLVPTGVEIEAGDKWDNKRAPALSGARICCPIGPFRTLAPELPIPRTPAWPPDSQRSGEERRLG